MNDDKVVIVPGRWGLRVCDLGQLIVGLLDEEPWEDVVDSAAIDDMDRGKFDEAFGAHVARIRALNDTGDAEAYWGF